MAESIHLKKELFIKAKKKTTEKKLEALQATIMWKLNFRL